MTRRTIHIVAAILALALLAMTTRAGDRYDLSWNSIDNGGVMFATGDDYVCGGTIGQPDAGSALTGGTYSLVGGFWAVDATLPGCSADIDGSGLVDAADLSLLLGNWGGAGVGDLNGSGTVDAGDLAVLLGGWGPC